MQPPVALISGASAGIGREFAYALAALGYQLVLVARRQSRLEQIAIELQQRYNTKVRVIVADLGLARSSAESPGRDLVENYLQQHHVDLLVNNAGFGSLGSFDQLPAERELEMIQVNITAQVALAQAVIPQMKARRSGTIISLSSIVAFQPLPFMATYSASKAFNLFHGLALREELAPFNVRVLVLCPGPTHTEFRENAHITGNSPASQEHNDSAQAVVANCLKQLQRAPAIIVPTWKSRLISYCSRILPYCLSLRLAGWAICQEFPQLKLERITK